MALVSKAIHNKHDKHIRKRWGGHISELTIFNDWIYPISIWASSERLIAKDLLSAPTNVPHKLDCPKLYYCTEVYEKG